MTDTTTTKAATKAPKATPAETLTAAIENLVAAAAAYAAADETNTTHEFAAAGFRAVYMGEQLSKLVRA